MHVVDHRGLGAAEREVQRILFQIHTLEFYGVRVALLCQSIHLGAARIAQTYYSGHLVVGFAHGIVPCGTEHFELVITKDLYQMSVPSAYHKRQERRLKIRMFYKVCHYVSLDMVDSDQRYACSKSHSLCKSRTH